MAKTTASGLNKWASSKSDAGVGAYKQGAWDADVKQYRDVMAKCRQYVTDFDKDGSKAEKLYQQLDQVLRRMRAHTSDGVDTKKAIEYVKEAESIATHKIGPASRATLEGQKNAKG